MTQSEYNLSGILGAIASQKNRVSNSPLNASIAGRSPVAKIVGQVAGIILRAKRPVSLESPIIFRLQKTEIQFRGAVIARLLTDGAVVIPHELDKIVIVG